MTVDHYAICPCGNGKKIKFCKCKESLPELDRVMTMIEGGQIVPAIDRLNQVLAEHPDAAWAMAIKGRLMLDLREYDALAENSERFVRLQPSNPLALAQRSAAELFHGQPQKATLSLLEALTESGRSVDSFVLDIASILAYSLAQSGQFLTARAYVQMPLTAQGYESNQTAVMVYQKLNVSDDLNHLLKTVPSPMPRDEDAPWAERFDEAIGLLRSNQILLAESKLQSLARTVPREPCVLTGLLTCAIWRGDVTTQADCLRKLSECESLDLYSRSKYLALAWLVEPDTPMVTINALSLETEIPSVDEAIMALSASSQVSALPPEFLDQFKELDDGVPPRAAFQILDRERPESTEGLSATELPLTHAIALIHGKQTDRAARCEVIDVRPRSRDAISAIFNKLLGQTTWAEKPERPMFIAEAAQLPLAVVGTPMDRKTFSDKQRELFQQTFADRLAETSLPCLGNRSLNETHNDASTLLARTALVRLLENFELLEDHDGKVMELVRTKANVETVAPIEVTSLQDIELLEPADLSYVDASGADVETLIFLFQRARTLNVSKLTISISQRLLETELPDPMAAAKLAAYTALIEFSSSPEMTFDLIEKAKAYAVAKKIDQANLRILEMTHRLMNGDQAGFNASLRYIADTYGNRPEVMARVQQLLTSLGLMRPDGSFRDGPPPRSGSSANLSAPAPSPGGGLWTPGSGSPAAAPAASGGGKLWIPGMD